MSGVSFLQSGDRMTQAEFHRRYEAYPDNVKAELIGGIVYMASPLSRPHGVYHPELGGAFWVYKSGTPGIELLDNATTILGEWSEPQPDLALRILTEYGGQSRVTDDDYVAGPPELAAEISYSTHGLDLNEKLLDYKQAGVLEYVVLCIEDQEPHWLNLKSGRALKPDSRGIYRSRVYPGLWINAPALLDLDSARILSTVQDGLASKAHAAFVKQLQSRLKKKR
jgi:hypothetical protein